MGKLTKVEAAKRAEDRVWPKGAILENDYSVIGPPFVVTKRIRISELRRRPAGRALLAQEER